MKELNKAIEKYKVDCVSDFYEIDKVSEFVDHINDTDNFKECLNNSIEKLEKLLETDKVAYCCLSNDEVYSFAEVLQIWEEDQEIDKTCEIVKYDDVESLFIFLYNNELMNDYEDYLFMEKTKKEVGETKPFAYDWNNQVLIKGE